MVESDAKIRVLDFAYKPFPSFAEFAAKTNVETTRWDRYNAELAKRRESAPELMNRAREIAKRAAAVDTGAIEGLYETDHGFTFSVALEVSAWESLLSQKGDNVRSLFDAQLQAYDYVLDLATKAEPISEAAIRFLHEVVCRAQTTYRVITSVGPQEQELPKGRYKIQPNHVRTRDGQDHSYAPVDVTPAEMARLIAEMRTDAFLYAHPILQAAYAHYGLVVIHPFSDGNGRVARALASIFTYRAISMPIMILTDQKAQYLDSLAAADGGDYQAFVDFMLSRALDTIQLVSDSLQWSHSPTPVERAAAINSLYVTKGGYTQEQVDDAGDRLLRLVRERISQIIASNISANLKGHVSLIVNRTHKLIPHKGYRLISGGDREYTLLEIELFSSPPFEERVYSSFAVFVPENATSHDDIQLVHLRRDMKTGALKAYDPVVRLYHESSDMYGKAFSARMDELIPMASGVLQIRVDLFAEHTVGQMLDELKSKVKHL